MKLAQPILSHWDTLTIARRFNAGYGLACASSPGGTAESPRPFRPSLRDSIRFATQPGVETPGYCQSSLRDKTVARFDNLRRGGIFGIQRKDAKAQRRQGTQYNFFAPWRLCAFALKNDAARPETQSRWDWNAIHFAVQN